MRVCVLASGSSGNCTYIGHEDTHILIDAGISRKKICKRLEEIGVEPSKLNAILLTHLHSDHCRHVYSMHKKFGTKVFLGKASFSNIENGFFHYDIPKIQNLQKIEPNTQIGALEISSFALPHSSPLNPFFTSNETLGFKFTVAHEKKKKSIGYATDLGHLPKNAEEHLKGCNTIIIESNHSEKLVDEAIMLISGNLGNRTHTSFGRSRTEIGNGIRERWVRSDFGHLSNEQCANALTKLITDQTKHIFLAHLSEDYNSWELASHTVSNTLTLGLENSKSMFEGKIHRTYRDGKTGQRSEFLEF